MKKPKEHATIAGAGVCCLDYVVVSPRVAWGDTAAVSGYCVQGGGLVATALVACTRLGARADLYSMVGDDSLAEDIAAGLHEEGISTDGLTRIPGGESPFSFVHVEEGTGERTIFHRYAKGMAWPGRDLSAIANVDALLVDRHYHDLSIEAMRIARKNGVPVIADASPTETEPEWLAEVDILIAPRHYLSEAGFGDDVGRALDAIHQAGPATALITLGADGWAASDTSGRSRGRAFEVDVVDTLGAGDVFHGAFAFALAQGWETPRCAEFASAVAALKCTQVGGRTGIPDLPGTLGFLAKHGSTIWRK